MSIEEWKPSAYGKASITIKNTNFSLESLGWLSEDRANASNYLATQEQVKTGGDGLKMHCSKAEFAFSSAFASLSTAGRVLGQCQNEEPRRLEAKTKQNGRSQSISTHL